MEWKNSKFLDMLFAIYHKIEKGLDEIKNNETSMTMRQQSIQLNGWCMG
jgi:hypothetical protein